MQSECIHIKLLTMSDNASVIIDGKKSTNKEFFDRMLRIFKSEVIRSDVQEELRKRRYALNPSQLRKYKKQNNWKKWKYYNN